MSEPVPDNTAEIVSVSLVGGRVTSGFRAALFAAAGRAGVSVNEFVLAAAGEKLKRAGARFPGVFRDEGAENERPDPFAEGSNRLVDLRFGPGNVKEREAIAFDRARNGRSMFEYAVALMRADVEERSV